MYENIVGKRFGKLVVIRFFGRSKSGKLKWECKCDCGKISTPLGWRIKSGNTISCGCFRTEKKLNSEAKKLIFGEIIYPSKTIEYTIWASMKQRCYYPKHNSYYLYGGRGISVCDEWKNSFSNFYRDMGKRPSDKHSLDRIDVNGNYEPSNCRWATILEQSNNRRTNVRFNGETARQASYRLGGGKNLVRVRIKDGWDIQMAFSRPVRAKARI